jgi:hypothetical protein
VRPGSAAAEAVLTIGTGLGCGNVPIVAGAVCLAFTFGYALMLGPLLRTGLNPRAA